MAVEEGQPTHQRCYPAEMALEQEVLGNANNKNPHNEHCSKKFTALTVSHQLICLPEKPTLPSVQLMNDDFYTPMLHGADRSQTQ